MAKHLFSWRHVALASALLCSLTALAQRVDIKTNALLWATGSPNLGAEFRVGRHVTLNFEGAVNYLKISSINTKAAAFMPEVRYWFSGRPLAGHFVGLMGGAASYSTTFSQTRHKGDVFAAGLTYGYSFVLSRHWSLEATAGVGVAHLNEKRFKTTEEAPAEANNKKWAPTLTKLGVTFVYIIK